MQGARARGMTVVTAALVLSTSAAWPSAVFAQDRAQTDGCPVTLPEHWPNTRAPWSGSAPPERGWYGSDQLAALLPADGIWKGMGPEDHYRDKFWWWRAGYKASEETQPDLVLSAVRLDGAAPPVTTDWATNAYGKGWDLMLVGMEFPTAGCWEIRGTYQGEQRLIVVVLVPEG